MLEPSSQPEFVGMPVEQIVCAMLRTFSRIAFLEFFVPRPVEPIQHRLGVSVGEARIVDRALHIRSSSGLPFWDAANLACFGEGLNAASVIREALFHNGDVIHRVRVPARSVTPEFLTELASAWSTHSILVWCSRVELDTGEFMHVPMLDFHCPESAANLDLVTEAVKLLGIGGGFILQSGKSYHFQGRSLITDSERIAFLSRSLLLAPIVDRAWIAHQLIEGSCGLRVSMRPGALAPPRVARAL